MASNTRRTPVFPLQSTQLVPPDVPHYASRQFAALLVSDALARYLNAENPKHGIVLRTKEPWAAIKSRYRLSNSSLRSIPRLLPPREPENLDLSYPAPSQETLRPAHAAFAEACRLAKIEAN